VTDSFHQPLVDEWIIVEREETARRGRRRSVEIKAGAVSKFQTG